MACELRRRRRSRPAVPSRRLTITPCAALFVACWMCGEQLPRRGGEHARPRSAPGSRHGRSRPGGTASGITGRCRIGPDPSRSRVPSRRHEDRAGPATSTSATGSCSSTRIRRPCGNSVLRAQRRHLRVAADGRVELVHVEVERRHARRRVAQRRADRCRAFGPLTPVIVTCRIATSEDWRSHSQPPPSSTATHASTASVRGRIRNATRGAGRRHASRASDGWCAAPAQSRRALRRAGPRRGSRSRLTTPPGTGPGRASAPRAPAHTEPLEHAAAALRHHRDDIGGARVAEVLDEVGVFGGEAGAADPQARGSPPASSSWPAVRPSARGSSGGGS